MTKFENCPKIDGLILKDISHEEWREYILYDQVYRIDNPVALYYGENNSTHRVVDAAGVAHCHLGPEKGAVIRWFNGEGNNPVNF